MGGSFALTAALPIFLVGIVLILFFEQQTMSKVQLKNELLADSVAENLRGLLREPAALMQQTAAQLSTFEGEHRDENIHAWLGSSVNTLAFFEAIYLIVKDGVVIDLGLPKERLKFIDDYAVALEYSRYDVYKPNNNGYFDAGFKP